jgi:cysteine-rich repeat protein
MRSFRPSPALVVAMIALFVALGGTGYAVTQLSKNSVGREQLQKGAVTTPKLDKGAVTSAKVKDGSIVVKDLKRETQAKLEGPPGKPGVNSQEGIPCHVSSPVAYDGHTHPVYRAGVAVLACRTSSTGVVGDSIVQSNEECDDGNFSNGDGCSTSGVIERTAP